MIEFIPKVNDFCINRRSVDYLFPDLKKNALYLSINVFSTKVTNWGHYFYVSNWRRVRHFTWSSGEPREGLAICGAKEVPSFLSYV